MAGALSYAELSTALPRSGGEYVFLSRIYHPAVGFLAGWISATVGFAAPVALAGMAFGKYFTALVPGVSPTAVGLIAVWGVTLVHLTGVRHGSQLQNIATVIKVALILVLIGRASSWPIRSRSHSGRRRAISASSSAPRSRSASCS